MKIIDFNKYPLPSRMRHHTSPNFYMPLNELKIIPKHYPPVYKTIDWSNIFANAKSPQILDIGCGRGLFLLSIAEQNPDKNMLGIEVRQWCCDWLANYINGEGIANCGILHYCISNSLNFIEDTTIDEVFYLFPDPWVKTKHLKRRAFNQSFLDEIYRVLNDGGKLFLATDLHEVHKYHIEMLKIFNKMKFSIIDDEKHWNKPLTNKEIFCKSNNIRTYKIIAHK